MTEEDEARIVAAYVAKNTSHDKGWYRMNAIRNLTGGPRLVPTTNERQDKVRERSLFNTYPTYIICDSLHTMLKSGSSHCSKCISHVAYLSDVAPSFKAQSKCQRRMCRVLSLPSSKSNKIDRVMESQLVRVSRFTTFMMFFEGACEGYTPSERYWKWDS